MFLWNIIAIVFIAFSVHAAEVDTAKEEGATTTMASSTVSGGVTEDFMDDENDWKMISQSPVMSKYMLEEIAKIMRKIDKPSVEDIPFEVFEIRPETMKALKGTTAFYAKSAAVTASTLWGMVPKSLGAVVNLITSPVISSVANTATKGDLANFPEISLQRIYEIIDNENILDRVSYAKLPVRKKSFHFETDEPGLIKTGYKGQLIIVDFAYGHRIPEYGDEPTALSQYTGNSPLDCMVNLKQLISPTEWLKTRYVIPSIFNLSKIAQAIRSVGGHTCRLYGIGGGSDLFMVLGMRIPEQEYKEIGEMWELVYNQNYKLPPTLKDSREPASKVHTSTDGVSSK